MEIDLVRDFNVVSGLTGAIVAAVGGFFAVKYGLKSLTDDMHELSADMADIRMKAREMESEHKTRLAAAENRIHQHDVLFGVYAERWDLTKTTLARIEHKIDLIREERK